MVIMPDTPLAGITATARQERMAWMDLLRGAASLFVLLLHATTLVRDFGLRPWAPLLAFNNALGPVRMPLLMMLSGMLLARSLSKPVVEYLVKKASALLYPFLLWTLILGLSIWPDQVTDPSLWMGASYLWFLLFLFTYYCFALLFRSVPEPVMIFIAAAVSMLSPDDSMYYERYFFLMAMFYVGKMLTNHPGILQSVMSRPGILVTGAAAIILIIVSNQVRMMKYHIEWAPLIIPGTLFLFWASHMARDIKGLDWLAMMGRNSIVTYVLHWPVIWIVMKLYADGGSKSPALISMTALVVAFLTCLLATIGRERYGMFGWLYKLPTGAETVLLGTINRLLRRPIRVS